MDTTIMVGGVSILALTVAIVQVMKSFLDPPREALPIFAMLIACTLSFLAFASGRWQIANDLVTVIVPGLVLGLSSMGLYSGVKAVSGK